MFMGKGKQNPDTWDEDIAWISKTLEFSWSLRRSGIESVSLLTLLAESKYPNWLLLKIWTPILSNSLYLSFLTPCSGPLEIMQTIL